MLRLIDLSRRDLLHYLIRQLEGLFPDSQKDMDKLLKKYLDEALARLEICISAVRMWRSGEFHYLHSSQYAIFLYFLANSIWRQEGPDKVCTKLFFLNKALNGIDCFYEIALPNVFFIGHSVGIVLAKASYGEYLVLYQNSTVGKNHGIAPTLGKGVILYPHTAVIGNSSIGDGSVISQGVSVINRNTPGHCLVFQQTCGDLIFRPADNAIDEFFFT